MQSKDIYKIATIAPLYDSDACWSTEQSANAQNHHSFGSRA